MGSILQKFKSIFLEGHQATGSIGKRATRFGSIASQSGIHQICLTSLFEPIYDKLSRFTAIRSFAVFKRDNLFHDQKYNDAASQLTNGKLAFVPDTNELFFKIDNQIN